MEITHLSENSTKIYVTKSEMEHLGVTFESLQVDSLATKLFFTKVLSLINQKYSENIYVEIFNLGEEGVLLYFSEKINTQNVPYYLVIETENPRKLLGFIKSLSGKCLMCKSSLYCNKKFSNRFRLLVKLGNDLYNNFNVQVNKFFEIYTFERIYYAKTIEHSDVWVEIIKNKALKTLSEVS